MIAVNEKHEPGQLQELIVVQTIFFTLTLLALLMQVSLKLDAFIFHLFSKFYGYLPAGTMLLVLQMPFYPLLKRGIFWHWMSKVPLFIYFHYYNFSIAGCSTVSR